MSVNKRKIIAYDDIEESADAKRLRYQGYTYGAQHAARPGVAAGPQDEQLRYDDEDERDLSLEEGEASEPVTQPRPHEPSRGYGQSKRQSQAQHGDSGPRPDHATGMRAFIPGLDDDGAQSDQDEETVDALAYLKSVRSEASGIPGLLVAPREAAYDEADSDHEEVYLSSRGYYDDGAYVRAPAMGPSLPMPSSATISVQEAYFRCLLSQFASTRRLLHARPPAPAPSTADSTTTYPAADAAAKHWTYTIRTADPRPRQLASMQTDTTLRLLRLCHGLLKRRRLIDQRFSAWLWSLLARLPDVGTLGSEEVSVVRDLGKRAVWVALGWEDAAIAAATAEQYDDAEEEGPADVASGRADENTRATLGMIVTVVGELYGQRDLLEFREQWPICERGAEPETGSENVGYGVGPGSSERSDQI